MDKNKVNRILECRVLTKNSKKYKYDIYWWMNEMIKWNIYW